MYLYMLLFLEFLFKFRREFIFLLQFRREFIFFVLYFILLKNENLFKVYSVVLSNTAPRWFLLGNDLYYDQHY
jgi:hypothetical protein